MSGVCLAVKRDDLQMQLLMIPSEEFVFKLICVCLYVIYTVHMLCCVTVTDFYCTLLFCGFPLLSCVAATHLAVVSLTAQFNTQHI